MFRFSICGGGGGGLCILNAFCGELSVLSIKINAPVGISRPMKEKNAAKRSTKIFFVAHKFRERPFTFCKDEGCVQFFCDSISYIMGKVFATRNVDKLETKK